MVDEKYKQYFEILEVEETATLSQIKRAHDRLLRLYMSDSMVLEPIDDEFDDLDKQEIMDEIKEAYQQLMHYFVQQDSLKAESPKEEQKPTLPPDEVSEPQTPQAAEFPEGWPPDEEVDQELFEDIEIITDHELEPVKEDGDAISDPQQGELEDTAIEDIRAVEGSLESSDAGDTADYLPDLRSPKSDTLPFPPKPMEPPELLESPEPLEPFEILDAPEPPVPLEPPDLPEPLEPVEPLEPLEPPSEQPQFELIEGADIEEEPLIPIAPDVRGSTDTFPESATTIVKRSQATTSDTNPLSPDDTLSQLEALQGMVLPDQTMVQPVKDEAPNVPYKGRHLKKAREKKGIGIHELAITTKISYKILVSIEKERYDKLPDAGVLRWYITTYAKALTLDPNKVADGYMKRYRHWLRTNPQ